MSPISTSGTVTGNYKTQYEVTFTATGLDADANGLVLKLDTDGNGVYDTSLYRASLVGAGYSFWVDSGTAIKYTYTNPVPSSDLITQYWLQSTTGPASTSISIFSVVIHGQYFGFITSIMQGYARLAIVTGN